MRDLAVAFCPELQKVIYWDSEATASTWNPSGETGKAVEFVTLCSLIASLRDAGAKVVIPSIFFDQPDLYYLRNVLPLHHGAQAGHEPAMRDIKLKDRFVAALTPKAQITVDGRIFGIYREGFPIHLIELLVVQGDLYQDRPDILLVDGLVETELREPGELGFEYQSSIGRSDGALRIKNDTSIPLIRYESSINGAIRTIGLIECSAGKPDSRAHQQLVQYLRLFQHKGHKVETFLVNGQSGHKGSFDVEVRLDMAGDIGKIRSQLTYAAGVFCGRLLESLKT